MISVPTITSNRLLLRDITLKDWSDYAAMWADPRVTAYIGGEPRDARTSWLKFCQAASMFQLLGYGNWVVIDKNDGVFLGVCGFADYKRGIAELDQIPECGWAFGAASWGRGIATEAVGAITRWADSVKIAETRCMIVKGNAASQKVAVRNGYVVSAKLSDESQVFRRLASLPTA